MVDRFPIVEIFGPVLEGEGPLAGQPTTFIRFGYCDSRCVWCDSMHAVLPELVSKSATWMTVDEIVAKVVELSGPYRWVTFSGGNPLMHDLTELVIELGQKGREIKVETQGTLWRDWILYTDLIILSPKPPSAGEYRAKNAMNEVDFYQQWDRLDIDGPKAELAIKIVVFDRTDMQYAVDFVEGTEVEKVYLSIGTYAEDTRDDLGERYAQLGEMALDLFAEVETDIVVTPQLQVIAYLHRQGV